MGTGRDPSGGTVLKRHVLSLLWGVVFVLGMGGVSAEAGVSSLRLRQTQVDLPRIQVFADLLDGEGRAVVPQSADLFSVRLGERDLVVRSLDQRVEQGTAMVFLVDTSRSLKEQGFAALRKTLSLWIREMGPRDSAALVSFGDEVKVVCDFTDQKEKLLYQLQQLKPKDLNTRLYQGILKGVELGRRRDPGLPSRRVVILFSDGIDDMPGGVTFREMLQAMGRDRIPVYALGSSASPRTQSGEEGLKKLGEIARASGGDLLLSRQKTLEPLAQELRRSLKSTFVLHLEGKDLVADGSVRRLQVDYRDGGVHLSEGMNLQVLAPAAPSVTAIPSPTPLPVWKRFPSWAYGAAGAGVLLLLVGVCLRRRRVSRGKEAKVESRNEIPPSSPVTVALEGSSTGEPLPTGLSSADVPGGGGTTVRRGSGAPASGREEPQQVEIALEYGEGKGGRRSLRATFQGQLVLGRQPGPTGLAIPGDGSISTRHCDLLVQSGRLFLKDLGSTNGTLVNGVPIQGLYPIDDGDRLLLGKTELRLVILRGVEKKNG